MKGAIIYASKYGSTAQYAQWIANATGLPLFNITADQPDPESYDFLILGSPVIYYKLLRHKWFKKHWKQFSQKPILFFTVSGAPNGEKLQEWIRNSLPIEFIIHMKHIALRGRQIPEQLTWFDRMNIKIAGLFNKDPQARKEELQGFDYMDRSTIAPIVAWTRQFKEEPLFV